MWFRREGSVRLNDLSGQSFRQLALRALSCALPGLAPLRGRKGNASPTSLAQADRDGLLRGPGTMFPLPHMLDLFMDKLSGGSRGRFPSLKISLRAFSCRLIPP
jgi:hypothetical protein